jgi:hypothetical protein
MTARTLGRWMLGFAIVTTVLIVAVADVFNRTHLFNEAWPPHARFHNAMQASTLLLTSCVSLWGLWRGHHGVAAIAPATFWPGLFIALPVPGTTVYATDAMREAGVPINLILAAVWLALTWAGYRLATRGALLGGERVANTSGAVATTATAPAGGLS